MQSDREMISRSESRAPYYVGIDLGGTNIKLGLVDDEGRTLAYHTIPTDVERGPEEGAQRMGEAVRTAVEQAGLQLDAVARVGLGTPGTMDIGAGMLLEPHNLPGWFHFPVRDRVSHHCGRPVTYTNDANAAAYGEFWRGSGREMRSMVFLTLGTGVGGGIIVGDLAIEGEHSAGAEVGHIIIDSRDDARRCPCGQLGHLEAYASATGVIARTEEALAEYPDSALARRRAEGEPITPLLVAEAAEAGDTLAERIVMETAAYLGIGITTLAHTIDPDGVVLGGAMTFGGPDSDLGRRFRDRIHEELGRRALGPVAENVTVGFATLGGDAGYVGAAGIARLDHQKNTAGSSN